MSDENQNRRVDPEAPEWDPELRKNYRVADFAAHHRLFNDMCRLFEQAKGTPDGTLQHLNKACLIETELMPIQIQDALDEYHVSHTDVPAFPFNDFVMLGNVGTQPPHLWPAVGAVLDVHMSAENTASAFVVLTVKQPNTRVLTLLYMGVHFKPRETLITNNWDLHEIHGKFDGRGVLHVTEENQLQPNGDRGAAAMHDVLAVWTQWLRLQLLYIDLPRHHVVVETPRNFRPPKERAPKATRAQDKERVRLIMPEHLRRVYPHIDTARDGAKTSREMAPHFRRGHTKLLSSSRWKDKQGQRVVVRPTWVGPEDWEHQGLKYRVVRPNERT